MCATEPHNRKDAKAGWFKIPPRSGSCAAHPRQSACASSFVHRERDKVRRARAAVECSSVFDPEEPRTSPGGLARPKSAGPHARSGGTEPRARSEPRARQSREGQSLADYGPACGFASRGTRSEDVYNDASVFGRSMQPWRCARGHGREEDSLRQRLVPPISRKRNEGEMVERGHMPKSPAPFPDVPEGPPPRIPALRLMAAPSAPSPMPRRAPLMAPTSPDAARHQVSAGASPLRHPCSPPPTASSPFLRPALPSPPFPSVPFGIRLYLKCAPNGTQCNSWSWLARGVHNDILYSDMRAQIVSFVLIGGGLETGYAIHLRFHITAAIIYDYLLQKLAHQLTACVHILNTSGSQKERRETEGRGGQDAGTASSLLGAASTGGGVGRRRRRPGGAQRPEMSGPSRARGAAWGKAPTGRPSGAAREFAEEGPRERRGRGRGTWAYARVLPFPCREYQPLFVEGLLVADSYAFAVSESGITPGG
ncbi:uncharacterized protein BXZ73DRAFT_79070 [Epithele typhae]|uniref:uncharacterized protein n=1 Tax=Epithele typhae TaxID=378194 RepID=UPI002008E3BC|nr:uncharacterized protein BXZ73DRAFT_79070 [Epithele typhae]KAH9925417.1 hypothetical protein BXZ73DRAFT_79070 [Epithele typhae]